MTTRRDSLLARADAARRRLHDTQTNTLLLIQQAFDLKVDKIVLCLMLDQVRVECWAQLEHSFDPPAA